MASYTTFTSKVAVVTGSAQGIGRSIALRLAEDGLDIALNDIESKAAQLESVSEQIKKIGRKAIVVVADVSKEEEVQKLVDRTVEELGRLDVMIANAGIASIGPILISSVEQWDNLWSINVRGVFLCYQKAAQQMLKQGGGGRIIGASSVTGKQGYRNLPAYSASKFAVRGLTQCVAQDLGEHGITVNAYAPGLISTPMTGGQDVSQTKALMGIPDAKTGQPEDVASLVSYLVKPEAHFITGQTIIVDGGLHFD